MLSIARKLPETPRKATYQDVLDAPENMIAQLVDGELYLRDTCRSSRPGEREAVFCD